MIDSPKRRSRKFRVDKFQVDPRERGWMMEKKYLRRNSEKKFTQRGKREDKNIRRKEGQRRQSSCKALEKTN